MSAHSKYVPFLGRCAAVWHSNESLHKILYRSQALLAIDTDAIISQDFLTASIFTGFILRYPIENYGWNEVTFCSTRLQTSRRKLTIW
jgi:hypothetical protein